MFNLITKKHRLIFIDGKIEFALFFDSSIKNKKEIMAQFLASKDWIGFSKTNEVKCKDIIISKDLKEIHIKTK